MENTADGFKPRITFLTRQMQIAIKNMPFFFFQKSLWPSYRELLKTSLLEVFWLKTCLSCNAHGRILSFLVQENELSCLDYQDYKAGAQPADVYRFQKYLELNSLRRRGQPLLHYHENSYVELKSLLQKTFGYSNKIFVKLTKKLKIEQRFAWIIVVIQKQSSTKLRLVRNLKRPASRTSKK